MFKISAQLCAPYLEKGHFLYMDSYYSSPRLFHFLSLNDMGACGTIKLDRCGLSDAIKDEVSELKKKKRNCFILSVRKRYAFDHLARH